MNDNEKTTQFLNTQRHMVLAVVTPDGTPWAVPVGLKSRQGVEFEWDSLLDTVHSQALEANPAMAITLYDGATGFGFYAKGSGALVEDRGDGYGRYRFTAEQCWINDETFVKREVTLG